VIPLFDADRKVWAVLDIDSTELDDFSEMDGEYLERFLDLLKRDC
jgi:putative methionine-R-sulfoxide reductase with GAF domain